ncbi:MAG: NAD(P)H-binding protein [Actinomycetota bacterium]|nr:NAD(P)H-binding protein [Actinomycetota bacterium]
MNIVVAGGTGFIGRHISRALMDSGHRVAVVSRRPDSAGRVPEVQGAESIAADVTDSSSLTGKLDGADAVVGAVQFPNHPVEVPRKGLTYDNFDRRGTENLIGECVRAGVDKFFYMSGAGADPTSDKSWYRAKGVAEKALVSSGLNYAILRPSWAYGPEDRALNRLAKIARWSPVVPRLGLSPQRIQPVSVDDIALAVQRAFQREDVWNRAYEIGGPDVLTMQQVLETMLEVLGKRRLIVPVPTALAKLGTAPLVLLPKPPMTPFGVEFAVQDGIVDTTDLEKFLEVQPVSLREGLSRYMTRG